MPRTKLRRDPCDCADCLDASPPPPTSAAGAAARQDPPPKSLVLCLSGAAEAAALREAHTPHLDAAVRSGWAGLLACRAAGPPLPLQLLGCEARGMPPPQRLPDRFKQIRAVLLTDTSEVAQAGEQAGCYAVHSLAGWPAPQKLAARISQLLGLQAAATAAALAAAAPALAAVLQAAGAAGSAQQQAEEEGDDVIDLLMLALDASQAPGSSDGGDASTANSTAGGGISSSISSISSAVAMLEWADELLRCLNSVPGFRDTVLLSLVVVPGAQPLSTAPLLQQEQALLTHGQPQAAAAAGSAAQAAAPLENGCWRVHRPLQSFQFAGQQEVEVDGQRPALVVHRLPGVIRVDGAAALDLGEVLARGAAGCILAERLLPEVAYKLGRAAKYGA